MDKQERDLKIRWDNFESHVRECDYCKASAVDAFTPCAAGNVMLVRYTSALVAAAVAR